MKSKLYRGVIVFILLAGLLVMAACTGNTAGGTTLQQAKVERGDITLSVSGNGKIQTSREARLTFGSAGKVSNILVKEGDKVKTGDVLARLDTTSLELALKQSQMSLTQAEGALMQALLAKESAEKTLEDLKNSGNSLQLALLNAQIGRDTARISLNAGVAAVDFTAADAELNAARTWYEYVQRKLGEVTTNVDSWLLAFDVAMERLDVAQAAYDNALSGYDSNQVNLKKKQLEAAELSVVLAQQTIDDLGKNISLQEKQVVSFEQTVKQSRQALELAIQSMADAQKQLNEAAVTAPFDGVVAAVLVKEGDMIPAPSMVPTTVIQLIVPNSLELVIEVDEIDIPSVKLAQEAVVEIDALPDAVIKGRVNAIYPVPLEQGGIVLYKVKITLEVPENSGTMIGMSASADIIAQKHENVLIVSSRAITTNSQKQSVVKVQIDEKKTEERVVTVGLDDGLKAEIISGLSEGETVIVEIKTKSAASSLF